MSQPATEPIRQNNTPWYLGPLIGLYLVGLMAVVITISYAFFMNESIRLDEAQSIWQASHSLPETLKIVAADVHVPLYHIVLHYWMIFFGTGIEAVRALSLIFFLVSLPLLYLLSRTLLSRPWSLVVVTLFALSPFMNWYANEARMYTLLAMFAILSQYFFIRILQNKPGWDGYALTVILGVYSHYFFIFTLAAQAIYFLFNRKEFRPGSFKLFILTAIGVVTSLAPWIYYFIQQGLASNTRPNLPTPSSVDLFNTFSQFLFGLQTDIINTIILSSWPILVIVAFFTVRKNLKVSPTVLYLLTASLLPVLLAFVLSFIVTPFFLSRYMMPAVAPLYIATAWLLSYFSKKGALIGIAIWASVIGFTFYLQTASPLNPVREDYQSAANYIEEHATVSDVVALTAPFTVYPFEYYYSGDAKLQTIPLWNRGAEGAIPAFNAGSMPEQVDQLINGHDYIYILASHGQGYEEEVLDYFITRYEQVEKIDYSEDMQLLVFRVGYDVQPKIDRP